MAYIQDELLKRLRLLSEKLKQKVAELKKKRDHKKLVKMVPPSDAGTIV